MLEDDSATKYTHSKKKLKLVNYETHKYTKGAHKQSGSSTPRNPLRSSNSKSLKTSKRGTKDVYVGENISKYFSNLGSGGANRQRMKGKTGTGLGNQQ